VLATSTCGKQTLDPYKRSLANTKRFHLKMLLPHSCSIANRVGRVTFQSGAFLGHAENTADLPIFHYWSGMVGVLKPVANRLRMWI